MAQSTRIAELSSIISSGTAKIDEYLQKNGVNTPSFEIDAPQDISEHPGIAKTRAQVLEATAELNELILGPRQYISTYLFNTPFSLHAVAHFDLANAFPVGSEASFVEISAKCKLPESDVARIIRHAAAQHIFKEVRKGVVAHTALSKLIAEDPLIRDWLLWKCVEEWRAAAFAVDAIAKWPGSQEPQHTAWSVANGVEGSIVQELIRFPDRLSRIGPTMQVGARQPSMSPRHFIEGFDWTGVETFVDVGGAKGAMSIEIARQKPGVKRFVVQDMPPVVQGEVAPPDVAGRVEFLGHDFFNQQPIEGADVYFFRWIFHDWSDKYCIAILKALVPALKKGASIVANDGVVPEPGTVTPYQERQIRSLDITMKKLMNGKERDAQEWKNLFAAADERFNVRRITLPPGATVGIIEVVWDG